MFNKQSLSSLAKKRDSIFELSKNNNSIISKIDFEKFDLNKDGKLSGVSFAIKDNFAVNDSITTSASKIMQNFKTNYNSTVFEKLINEGAVPLFKANLDELAMGGTGLTSNFGPVYNPFDKNYLVGGSSSGSNYLLSDGSVEFAIGSDTGDSVRKPAAWTGVVGFKPTWGLISRNGLYDFAPTWDTVGWFTNNVEQSALLMSILNGFDKKDNSSIKSIEENDFSDNLRNDEKYTVAKIKDIEKYILDKEILIDYMKSIELANSLGHKIKEVEVDYKILEATLITYRIISSVESFSCNSNLTGFHFGDNFDSSNSYEESIINARSKSFGYEVKKRFLYAQEVRYSDDPYYKKALKMRTLIKNEINKVLDNCDVLLIPSTAILAPNVEKMKAVDGKNVLDNFLTIFNVAGAPSLSMPVTKNKNKSTSINISAKAFDDKKVFKFAKVLEEALND